MGNPGRGGSRESRPISRRKQLAFVGLLACGSLTALLVLGELLARWQVEGGLGAALASILRLRTAEVPGAEQLLVEDPELGFKLNPASEGVNSLGIRGPEIECPKPPGRWRVLVLGDSISFPEPGWVVALAATLRAAHGDAIEVVNAACHGYTTYQERVFLERDLLALSPDLVLLQYCVNDNWRFLHRLTSGGRRLLTPEAKAYLFPERDGFLGWLYRTSYLAYGLRRWSYGQRTAPVAEFPWDDDVGAAPAWRDASWVEQEEHFASMAAKLRAVGGRLVVLAVPIAEQLDPVLLAKDAARTRKPQRRLGAICARIDVPYLDLHDAFAAQRAAGLFTDGVHLTTAGHTLVAREVAALLARAKLAPSR